MKRMKTFMEAVEYAQRQANALGCIHWITELGGEYWVMSHEPSITYITSIEPA